MRFCSTLAAGALLFAQSAAAFDASTLNFESQAYDYANSISYSSLGLNDVSSASQQDDMRFDDSPSHRLPRYLSTSPEKDWDYLMGQTYTILGLSVATVGMMTFLP